MKPEEKATNSRGRKEKTAVPSYLRCSNRGQGERRKRRKREGPDKKRNQSRPEKPKKEKKQAHSSQSKDGKMKKGRGEERTYKRTHHKEKETGGPHPLVGHEAKKSEQQGKVTQRTVSFPNGRQLIHKIIAREVT